MRVDVMGVGFDNVTMHEALSKAQELLQKPQCSYIVTPNAEMVYEAMNDPSFSRLLNEADLVLPDGAGVVLGSKLLRTPLKEKVAGVDFADGLLDTLIEMNKTLYLLGGKPGVGELAAQNMQNRHPGLSICGIADGYFQDEQQAVDAINQKAPDVLFVCLGSPKQEQFIQAHLQEISASLMIGLGGSLDAFAGTVKRAPAWMIRLNLEWLYRLIKEPKRFKRMLRLPKFLWAVVRRRMRGT